MYNENDVCIITSIRFFNSGILRNIYIFIVVALDQTLYSRCLYFSMQNIEKLHDLTNVNVSQWMSLFIMLVWRNYRITMT